MQTDRIHIDAGGIYLGAAMANCVGSFIAELLADTSVHGAPDAISVKQFVP